MHIILEVLYLTSYISSYFGYLYWILKANECIQFTTICFNFLILKMLCLKSEDTFFLKKPLTLRNV